MHRIVVTLMLLKDILVLGSRQNTLNQNMLLHMKHNTSDSIRPSVSDFKLLIIRFLSYHVAKKFTSEKKALVQKWINPFDM